LIRKEKKPKEPFFPLKRQKYLPNSKKRLYLPNISKCKK